MTYEEKLTDRRDKYAWLAETSPTVARRLRSEGYAAGLTLALRYYKGELT